LKKSIITIIFFGILFFGCNVKSASKVNVELKKLQYVNTESWNGFWQLNDGVNIPDNQSIRILLSGNKYLLELRDDNGIQKGEAVEVSKGQLKGWLEKDGKIEITRYSPLDYKPQDNSAIRITFLDWKEQLPIGPYAIINK